jgi:hypothetical protein
MPTGTHGFYSKGLMELVEEQAQPERPRSSPPPQRCSNESDHFRFWHVCDMRAASNDVRSKR